jgi:hypothetical protein
MDGKRMILIVNFLGQILVAFRKTHGKPAVLPGSNYLMGFTETRRSLGAPLSYNFN